MESSDTKLVQALTSDEGYRRAVYKDSRGYWTIGIGRMVDDSKGGGVTLEEAQYLLANDLKSVFKALDSNLPWWRQMTENRQRVLANMCFNMGITTLLTFKNTLASMKAGDYDKAADGMQDSAWAKQVGNRATRLIKEMRAG